MCKKLKVSNGALINKKTRLALGPFLESGDYITLNQLFVIMGVKLRGNDFRLKTWLNKGFPLRYQQRGKKKIRIVKIDEFWKWADENRSLVDFSRLEKNILGIEPDWVKQQRMLDYKVNMLFKRTPWTDMEDKKLLMLLKEYKYTYLDLSKKLHRTSAAIEKRIRDLGYKERPLRADNKKCSAREFEEIISLISQGANYSLISAYLNKSEKAIRGRIYREFGIEDIDEVRKKIKNKEGK